MCKQHQSAPPKRRLTQCPSAPRELLDVRQVLSMVVLLVRVPKGSRHNAPPSRRHCDVQDGRASHRRSLPVRVDTAAAPQDDPPAAQIGNGSDSGAVPPRPIHRGAHHRVEAKGENPLVATKVLNLMVRTSTAGVWESDTVQAPAHRIEWFVGELTASSACVMANILRVGFLFDAVVVVLVKAFPKFEPRCVIGPRDPVLPSR